MFRTKNTEPNRLMNFELCGTNIEMVRVFETLGVIFAESMKSNENVKYVASKLSRIAGLTFVTEKMFSTDVKLIIYNSLFSPHLLLLNLGPYRGCQFTQITS